jgi:hypothetical protein
MALILYPLALVINTLGAATDLSLLYYVIDLRPQSKHARARIFALMASLESHNSLIGAVLLYPVYQ